MEGHLSYKQLTQVRFLQLRLAGEWNGIPFQPHTLKIAGSTPVPAIIAEWSDGQGGTLIRCDMPVRIRLLQRSVLRGHCSDEKNEFYNGNVG